MEKRTGFTLVELLAVIVILAIILMITVPGVLSIINKTKNEAYESQQKMIKEATRNYLVGQRNQVVWNGQQTIIGLTDLQDAGYLEKNLIDPRDKSKLTNISVLVTKQEKKNKLEIVYTDSSSANYPLYKKGMIPVVYDGGTWVKADVTNQNQSWFDYSNQQWANVATVTEDVRQTLLNAPVGTEVPMEKINAMFVWIPRFKYKLWNTDGLSLPQSNPNLLNDYTIDVQFQTPYKEKEMGTQNGEWLTHPGFTFGENELYGFWMAKFQVSYNQGTDFNAYTDAGAKVNANDPSKLLIKPNGIMWRSISLSNIMKNCMQMNQEGNIFGLESDSTPHLTKNMEWGAFAYLTNSKYGKTGNKTYQGEEREVRANNNNTYHSGCGASVINEYEKSVCNTYETKHGQAASTTGNITGVYDASGAAYEFVATAIQKADQTIFSLNSGYSQAE